MDHCDGYMCSILRHKDNLLVASRHWIDFKIFVCVDATMYPLVLMTIVSTNTKVCRYLYCSCVGSLIAIPACPMLPPELPQQE